MESWGPSSSSSPSQGSPQRLWALPQPKPEPGSYQRADEPCAEQPPLLQSILSAQNKPEAERERGEEREQHSSWHSSAGERSFWAGKGVGSERDHGREREGRGGTVRTPWLKWCVPS